MKDSTEFTVMTMNVGGAKQVRQQRLDIEKFVSDIVGCIPASVKPDIIAVHESHEVWNEEGVRFEKSEELSKKLSETLGKPYKSYFSPYLDSDYHSHFNKWERKAFKGFSRVKQGNAIVTNKSTGQWPWNSPPQGYPTPEEIAPISTQISGATLFSTGNRNTEPRALMVVPLSLGGVSLYFMATHLATLTGEKRNNKRHLRSKKASEVRFAQAKEIIQVVEELREAEQKKELTPLPMILAGDFNAQVCTPEIDVLEQTFVRLIPCWYDGSKDPVWTHVGHKIHVDHIFYDDPADVLTLRGCSVLPPKEISEVIDHLPIVATFKIDPD